MSFDIEKLGIPILIALVFSVIFGSISGHLRKQKEKKEYERLTGGARRPAPRRR